jgi:hypothetical protein
LRTALEAAAERAGVAAEAVVATGALSGRRNR